MMGEHGNKRVGIGKEEWGYRERTVVDPEPNEKHVEKYEVKDCPDANTGNIPLECLANTTHY